MLRYRDIDTGEIVTPEQLRQRADDRGLTGSQLAADLGVVVTDEPDTAP